MLLSICVYNTVVYIYSAGYVELPIVLLYFEVSILMLGVSHVIQNKEKL